MGWLNALTIYQQVFTKKRIYVVITNKCFGNGACVHKVYYPTNPWQKRGIMQQWPTSVWEWCMCTLPHQPTKKEKLCSYLSAQQVGRPCMQKTALLARWVHHRQDRPVLIDPSPTASANFVKTQDFVCWSRVSGLRPKGFNRDGKCDSRARHTCADRP